MGQLMTIHLVSTGSMPMSLQNRISAIVFLLSSDSAAVCLFGVSLERFLFLFFYLYISRSTQQSGLIDWLQPWSDSATRHVQVL